MTKDIEWRIFRRLYVFICKRERHEVGDKAENVGFC